ncbi:growth-regulating factor 1-like [Olea europaea subsp. europaea]|uniref:Growth-regulating factor n=1 Tax=Olea europaea subsp. europaea TaxID=158383 RepID=A0A8S0UMG8_OLEEU|nr:growth-regulating factor 1-like [Olea europaea subsp. europaea]
MDFGVITHQDPSPKPAGPDSTEPSNGKRHGSGNLKQDRSENAEDTRKESKIARTTFGIFDLWPSGCDDGQKMLSFSSADLHSNGRNDTKYYSRTGGELNVGMHGSVARFRGPFTPAQWMELEHQALIYKHMLANVPVPYNLIMPLLRSLYPYATSGSYASNSLGWGPLHLGFSGSNDPEPGRCRRTDGKKWRCSKDAVPDQKYCERHINRGRNRSRKPVEGLKGHAVSGSTTNVAPIASSSASVMSSSIVSNNLGSMPNRLNSFESYTAKASNNYLVNSDNKHAYGRTQKFQSLTLTPTSINPKPKEAPFSFQKQHAPFEEFSHLEFGVNSDSRVNPSTKFSYVNTTNPNSFLDLESNDQNLVSQFIDSTDRSDLTSVSWPKKLKSDWTQLSISPMAPPDFSLPPDSPPQSKATIMPLLLSPELDPVQMSLGINTIDESNHKQSTWLPVSWGISMGGPLGEVLTSTSTNAGVGNNSTVLNLMTEAG